MANPVSATPTHLDPSALGTKEYWDRLYETELANHTDNPADEGTVWFDDADAEARMVQYLDELESDSLGSGSASGSGFEEGLLALDRARAAVLDLGCGNGSLLFALRDDGWNGRLLGVDYSATSVRLARAVAASRGVGATGGRGEDDEVEDGEGEQRTGGGSEDEDVVGEKEVDFKVWDVLNGALDEVQATRETDSDSDGDSAGAGWDVVLDKGTFDAVSLSGERDAQGRRVCEGYGARVIRLLRTGGTFLVTSCNWTEEELREWFDGKTEQIGGEVNGRVGLRLAGRIAYPSFSFGGVKGQTISTLCFQKVAA